MIERITDTSRVRPLFKGWDETLIASCLDGIMGEVYAQNSESPKCAFATLGDFGYLGGTPEREMCEFVKQLLGDRFFILVPQNDAWTELIQDVFGRFADRIERYAIKKEEGVFDRTRLEAAVKALADGYTLQSIDESLYNECLRHEWSKDFVAQYKNYAQYKAIGLGTAVLYKGEIVAGTSSYSSFDGGIEIEVVTREDHRRKGLAFSSSAKLILDCLDRGLYPSWDARTMYSVKLAEKLGYHYSHPYTAVDINSDKSL